MASSAWSNISAVMSEYFENDGGAQRLETSRLDGQHSTGAVTLLRTPGTAAAALETAHGVRVRRAEQWAAARKKRVEEGGKWGRKKVREPSCVGSS